MPSVLVVFVLFALVCSSSESANPFKESIYFRELSRTINAYSDSLWRANFGPQNFTIQLSSTKEKTLHKRQASYSQDVDWRTTGVIGRPEHQGACGSCWAFASVHALQDNIRIHGGVPALSVQHVLECCMSQACGGCSGASDSAAGFDFLSRMYTVEQSCKSYKYSEDQTTNIAYSRQIRCSSSCDDNSYVSNVLKFSMTGFVRLNSNTHDIKQELLHGPLLAAIELYGDLYLYESGIYKHVDGPFLGYHSVEIVGSGHEAGQNYWVVKNSWGEEWGEGGYFRITAGINEVKIEEYVIKPILTGSRSNQGTDKAFSDPVGGNTLSDVNDYDIQEVAKFIAHEIRPVCFDGKLDGIDKETTGAGEAYNVEKIHQASRKVVAGIEYNLKIEVSLRNCSKVTYLQAKVYLPANDRVYYLQEYSYLPSSSRAMISSCFLVVILAIFTFFN